MTYLLKFINYICKRKIIVSSHLCRYDIENLINGHQNQQCTVYKNDKASTVYSVSLYNVHYVVKKYNYYNLS